MTQSGKKREQGLPGKPPGIKDVARLASVSAATVSLVLNDVAGARVSLETRRRIHGTPPSSATSPTGLARGCARAVRVSGLSATRSRPPRSPAASSSVPRTRH